ncbi:MAG: cobalamin-binding protein [Gemmatimonadaceae bacterium]
MRVVSLLPSATEIVAALGALEHLVGVTHACDHPPMVASRARVTAEGQPPYTLLEDRIRALHPDLIITQAHCDDCAVMETDVRALAERLSPVPQVLTLEASSLDAVLEDIARVGTALGLDDEADELLAGARARIRSVHAALKAARAPRPRVAVIEWGEPIHAAGHWVPEMVHRAGGVDVLAKKGEHSVVVTLEAVRAADAEVIIIAPCGYELARSAQEGERLLALAGWQWARERRVFAIDANAFASRPGPRLVDGIEVFARCFNPALFSPMDPDFATALTAAARTD